MKLPEKKDMQKPPFKEVNDFKEGWNACLDKVAELNAAEQVGENTINVEEELIKAMSKFSLPDKERIKEIIKEVLREFLPHRNSEDKYLNDLANALASALTKEEK